MGTRKRWTKTETRRLTIAYQMGATYFMLRNIIDRSATSINKYLCRSGLRPLGSVKKGKKAQSRVLNLNDIWQEIHRQEALEPFDLLDKGIPQKPVKLPVHLDLKEIPSAKPEPDAEYCDDLTRPIAYLTALGHKVQKASLNWADYIIDARPTTTNQLIIFVNRMRYDLGLKPFVVSGFIK